MKCFSCKFFAKLFLKLRCLVKVRNKLLPHHRWTVGPYNKAQKYVHSYYRQKVRTLRNGPIHTMDRRSVHYEMYPFIQWTDGPYITKWTHSYYGQTVCTLRNVPIHTMHRWSGQLNIVLFTLWTKYCFM